mgnify:CR=1 FL=1
MTEQHALAIDVGGSVIVRDPLNWHAMPGRIERLERQIELLKINETNWHQVEVTLISTEQRVLDSMPDDFIEGVISGKYQSGVERDPKAKKATKLIHGLPACSNCEFEPAMQGSEFCEICQ